ncbi:MAG: hypothetical protein AAF211_31850, partial [Myxococcota bacterium]
FEDCVNGLDDDGDGAVDCADGACRASPNCCPRDRVNQAAFSTTGDLADEFDLFSSVCTQYVGQVGSGPDYAVEFRAPTTGDYLFSSVGSEYFTIISLWDACGGNEIDCNDFGLEVVRTLNAGETVIVAAESFGVSFAGEFALTILPVTNTEQDCSDRIDGDLDRRLDCFDPDCEGDPACVELDCTDGIDNDDDFRFDCEDRDCDLDTACIEICDDGIDNDGDFFFDCQDGGCLGDPACCISQGTLVFGDQVDTRFGSDKNTPSCALSFASDVTWEFTAPEDGDYTFDTLGAFFDTVLYVLDDCGGTELACNDDTSGSGSEVTVPLTAGQTVVVVVDGFAGSTGFGTLSVTRP